MIIHGTRYGISIRMKWRLETRIWRSYYEHRSLRLFADLVTLLREQYHLPSGRRLSALITRRARRWCSSAATIDRTTSWHCPT